MAASAKTLVFGIAKASEDWTVVLPRHGKERRKFSNTSIPKQQEEQPWAPHDIETNPERELKLLQKMQSCIQKLEISQFYQDFLDRVESPEVLNRFLKVLGSESSLQMVVYGIGSIESFDVPRLQLGLAILMKIKFSWIGDIEIFDPIISLTELRVLEALGCSVLSVNEQCRRQALKPTLFFMPHCEADLYRNLLQANWRVDLLDHMVLFGNSFETYDQLVSLVQNSAVTALCNHILTIKQFIEEIRITTTTDDDYRAFNGSSWHFFNLEPEANLQLKKVNGND